MALNRIKTLAAALPLAFSAAITHAEEPEISAYAPESEVTTPIQKEAWDLADDYALENAVVAIALYAPENHPDIEHAQAVLEGWFAHLGIPTETFIGISENGGFKAGYFVKGVAYGPTVVNPSVAIPKMQQAATDFPSAWESELMAAKADEPATEEYLLVAN